MNTDFKPVLAMYDVRGKQSFIYRSKHIKEIIGGSEIIRSLFEKELSYAAQKYRNKLAEDNGKKLTTEDEKTTALFNYKDASGAGTSQSRFSYDEFTKRMRSSNEQFIGEIVYDGGGNFLVLFMNEEVCREVTYLFSRCVIEKYSSLRVACTFIDELNPDRFHGDAGEPGDYEKLYDKHRFTENEQITAVPYGTLPIVRADYLTSMPLIIPKETVFGSSLEVTTESAAKYQCYYSIKDRNNVPDEKVLDKMVTQKGVESLLAVIYFDGNNMGANVQRQLTGKTKYDECVNALREFSEQIQKVFVDDRISTLRGKSDGGNTKKRTTRIVIGAGDEITVICNARDAYGIASEYLKALPDDFTSCAGIAVFHSHAPYSEAYRIAEECCTSGKSFMRNHGISDLCMMDFHYCQGAIGVSLDQIREDEDMADNSRPWLIVNKEAEHAANEIGAVSEEDVVRMAGLLSVFGRSNIKGLVSSAELGNTAFEMEIRRIEGHLTSAQKDELKNRGYSIQDMIYSKIDYARKLILDIMIVYDLWNDTWKQPESEYASQENTK